MAVAQSLLQLDHWLVVRDSSGRAWRYEATDVVAEGSVVHVRQGKAASELVRDRDGVPLLRQDGAGLPRVIAVAPGWQTPVEYRLVSAA